MAVAGEVIKEKAVLIKAGKSDWSRIADLFVLFMYEFPEKQTAKDFVDWIVSDAPDWLNEETTWGLFFGVERKEQVLKFIEDWINEEDIPAFMDFVKEKDEKLWTWSIR
jgi:hypothetical protein